MKKKDSMEGLDKTKQEITATFSSLSNSTPIDIEPGVILLERYKVIHLLGIGGMGSVFRVQHLGLNKPYALKCLNKSQTSDVDWRRFEVEAKAANRLDHQNLVKVHDFGLLPDGKPFFVMDLVEGKSLAEILKTRGVLKLPQALQIFIQVGFALSYAHQHGIIHRDIKPSNIMIVGGGENTLTNSIKVVDFGLAKITGADEFNQQTLTKTGEIFGSPLYMSPEQCMGAAVDNRCDLYSLGCVIFESLTGAPPLIGDTALSTMMKHQTEKPLSLKEASLGLEYPRSMESIVAKLLEKTPDKRYQDATTLTSELVALEQHLKENSSSSLLNTNASPGSLMAEPAAPLVRLGWPGFVAGLVIGIAVGAISEYLFLHPQTLIAEKKAPTVSITPPVKVNVEQDQFHLSAADLDDKVPFSTISKNGTRTFKFPNVVIGTIFNNRINRLVFAKGTVPISHFQPVCFLSNEISWHYPEIMKRFRDDELVKIELIDCDENLDKFLENCVHIQSVEKITIDQCILSNKTLSICDKFPRLKYLSLKETRKSPDELLKLKRFYNLEVLDLDCGGNLKPLFPEFKRIKGLKGLSLSNCDLTSEDIDEIVQCKGLTSLAISHNHQLGDAQLKRLSALKKITILCIRDTKITPKSIDTLKQFPDLSAVEFPDWSDAEIQSCLKELPNVHVRGHKTMGEHEERIYEEELRKNGKLNKGLGADR